MTSIINVIGELESVLWGYLCFSMIMLVGAILTVRSRFYQISVLLNAKKYIKALASEKTKDRGISPFFLYFTSIAGMIGLGNIVTITAVVTIGGPGGIFWLWIAFFIGMIVKYAEIYLGILYREHHGDSYDGGPMYYLKNAFTGRFMRRFAPCISAIFICVYGVEVLQFKILTDSFVNALEIDRIYAITILLFLVMISTIGGVRRLSKICTAMMPPFLIVYLISGLTIICANIDKLPHVLSSIFASAFTGHAAISGFAGSTILMAIQQGFAKGVYSGDIAIGYDSIVQSETHIQNPEKQSVMAIFGITTELIICSITLLLIMVTGYWDRGLSPDQYILAIFSDYLPNDIARFYIFALFFAAGFTTIIGYFVVGQKCARYLSPKYGKKIYMCCGFSMYVFFAMCELENAMMLMSLTSAFLILINLLGVYKLRDKIDFPRLND